MLQSQLRARNVSANGIAVFCHSSEAFNAASKQPWVKGFAIGRTLFAEAAQGWLQGHLDDAQAIKLMATNYRLIIAAWDNAQAQK